MFKTKMTNRTLKTPRDKDIFADGYAEGLLISIKTIASIALNVGLDKEHDVKPMIDRAQEMFDELKEEEANPPPVEKKR